MPWEPLTPQRPARTVLAHFMPGTASDGGCSTLRSRPGAAKSAEFLREFVAINSAIWAARSLQCRAGRVRMAPGTGPMPQATRN